MVLLLIVSVLNSQRLTKSLMSTLQSSRLPPHHPTSFNARQSEAAVRDADFYHRARVQFIESVDSIICLKLRIMIQEHHLADLQTPQQCEVRQTPVIVHFFGHLEHICGNDFKKFLFYFILLRKALEEFLVAKYPLYCQLAVINMEDHLVHSRKRWETHL